MNEDINIFFLLHQVCTVIILDSSLQVTSSLCAFYPQHEDW